MKDLKIVPIDFVNRGQGFEPSEPVLYSKVQGFAREQFGAQLEFSEYQRVWAAVADQNEVIGVMGIAQVMDCPLFHVREPNAIDKQDKVLSLKASKELAARAISFLQDNGMTGKAFLIYIHPDQIAKWTGFLDSLGIEQAHRFRLEI